MCKNNVKYNVGGYLRTHRMYREKFNDQEVIDGRKCKCVLGGFPPDARAIKNIPGYIQIKWALIIMRRKRKKKY